MLIPWEWQKLARETDIFNCYLPYYLATLRNRCLNIIPSLFACKLLQNFSFCHRETRWRYCSKEPPFTICRKAGAIWICSTIFISRSLPDLSHVHKARWRSGNTVIELVWLPTRAKPNILLSTGSARGQTCLDTRARCTFLGKVFDEVLTCLAGLQWCHSLVPFRSVLVKELNPCHCNGFILFKPARFSYFFPFQTGTANCLFSATMA